MIIPAFNEEKYLPQCLTSLKGQSYSPLEVIVIDNNSTDQTAEIAKKFGAKVVFEKKQGTAHARDAGFKAAQGEIIARTDADTILPSDWLLTIIKNFEKNPAIIGITGSIRFYDLPSLLNFISRKANTTGSRPWMKPIQISLAEGKYRAKQRTTGSCPWASISQYCFILCLYLFRIVTGHYHFMGPTCAIKRRVLTKISPFSDNPYCQEDMDLACHIAAHGKIIFDPALIVNTSSRRLKKKPLGTVIKYTLLWLYSVLIHGHPFVRNHRKSSIKAKRR